MEENINISKESLLFYHRTVHIDQCTSAGKHLVKKPNIIFYECILTFPLKFSKFKDKNPI